ncbi:acetate kinase [uncultured Alistipes sp.]|uniref:acetate/propionate family kinase n=1 Tax=uncultured Alistipes sp. TaxID=538949 RepID=UPI003207A5D0
MVILVLNCGSSSIKYQVIDMTAASGKLLAKGLVERIGLPEGDLTHKPVGKTPFEVHQPIPDHTTGIKLVLDALTDPSHGVIASLDEVKAVGHRVAHGGEYFPASCLVTEEVKEKIRSLCQIAPLHNPASLEGINAVEKVLPGTPQVTVFDTSFHQTIPAVNYMYALPYEYYEKYRVRKYGFHGTSHKYVARVGAELAGLDFEHSKIITCHIGNGGSVTAVLNGKSFDTSMGFSPLDGLVMGTRCGQVDASAITFIGEKEGMSYAELETMMNKKSGVMGLTGISSDMRDIDHAYEEGNPRAILARDMYYRRIKKFVGEYAAEMGGVDLIVFTGGVGENSSEMRESVCTGLEFMGVKFDTEANKGARGVNKLLSAADSKVKVAVIATDEELMIATDTYNLVK